MQEHQREGPVSQACFKLCSYHIHNLPLANPKVKWGSYLHAHQKVMAKVCRYDPPAREWWIRPVFDLPWGRKARFFRLPTMAHLLGTCLSSCSFIFDHWTVPPSPFLPRFHDTTFSKAAPPSSCYFIKSFSPCWEVEESRLHLIYDNLLVTQHNLLFCLSLLLACCIVVGQIPKIIIGKRKKKLFRRWLSKYPSHSPGNESILSETSIWNNNVRGKENEKFPSKKIGPRSLSLQAHNMEPHRFNHSHLSYIFRAIKQSGLVRVSTM